MVRPGLYISCCMGGPYSVCSWNEAQTLFLQQGELPVCWNWPKRFLLMELKGIYIKGSKIWEPWTVNYHSVLLCLATAPGTPSQVWICPFTIDSSGITRFLISFQTSSSNVLKNMHNTDFLDSPSSLYCLVLLLSTLPLVCIKNLFLSMTWIIIIIVII